MENGNGIIVGMTKNKKMKTINKYLSFIALSMCANSSFAVTKDYNVYRLSVGSDVGFKVTKEDLKEMEDRAAEGQRIFQEMEWYSGPHVLNKYQFLDLVEKCSGWSYWRNSELNEMNETVDPIMPTMSKEEYLRHNYARLDYSECFIYHKKTDSFAIVTRGDEGLYRNYVIKEMAFFYSQVNFAKKILAAADKRHGIK